MAVGAVAALLIYLGSLQALAHVQRLPPPQFANSLCVDEKLRAMRLAPPDRPNLLIVGSSVAWRHFSGATARSLDPAIRPYNAAFCHANTVQTYTSTKWLIGRLPDVEQVVLIVSPVDLQQCASAPEAQFDIDDADAYVFGHQAPLVSYLKYFDPLTLFSNARTVKFARTSNHIFDSLVMTPTGDGPSDPPWRGLHYGRVRGEAECFAAVGDLAKLLTQRGIRLNIAMTPMHAQWKTRFGGKDYPRNFERRIAAAIGRTPAQIQPPPRIRQEADFYDAMHLRWGTADAFTKSLLQGMNGDCRGQAASPHCRARFEPAKRMPR